MEDIWRWASTTALLSCTDCIIMTNTNELKFLLRVEDFDYWMSSCTLWPVIGTSIGEVCQIWRNFMRLPQIRGLRWGWCKRKKPVRFEGEVWGQIFKKRAILNLNLENLANVSKRFFSSLFLLKLSKWQVTIHLLEEENWMENHLFS